MLMDLRVVVLSLALTWDVYGSVVHQSGVANLPVKGAVQVQTSSLLPQFLPLTNIFGRDPRLLPIFGQNIFNGQREVMSSENKSEPAVEEAGSSEPSLVAEQGTINGAQGETSPTLSQSLQLTNIFGRDPRLLSVFGQDIFNGPNEVLSGENKSEPAVEEAGSNEPSLIGEQGTVNGAQGETSPALSQSLQLTNIFGRDPRLLSVFGQDIFNGPNEVLSGENKSEPAVEEAGSNEPSLIGEQGTVNGAQGETSPALSQSLQLTNIFGRDPRLLSVFGQDIFNGPSEVLSGENKSEPAVEEAGSNEPSLIGEQGTVNGAQGETSPALSQSLQLTNIFGRDPRLLSVFGQDIFNGPSEVLSGENKSEPAVEEAGSNEPSLIGEQGTVNGAQGETSPALSQSLQLTNIFGRDPRLLSVFGQDIFNGPSEVLSGENKSEPAVEEAGSNEPSLIGEQGTVNGAQGETSPALSQSLQLTNIFGRDPRLLSVFGRDIFNGPSEVLSGENKSEPAVEEAGSNEPSLVAEQGTINGAQGETSPALSESLTNIFGRDPRLLSIFGQDIFNGLSEVLSSENKSEPIGQTAALNEPSLLTEHGTVNGAPRDLLLSLLSPLLPSAGLPPSEAEALPLPSYRKQPNAHAPPDDSTSVESGADHKDESDLIQIFLTSTPSDLSTLPEYDETIPPEKLAPIPEVKVKRIQPRVQIKPILTRKFRPYPLPPNKRISVQKQQPLPQPRPEPKKLPLPNQLPSYSQLPSPNQLLSPNQLPSTNQQSLSTTGIPQEQKEPELPLLTEEPTTQTIDPYTFSMDDIIREIRLQQSEDNILSNRISKLLSKITLKNPQVSYTIPLDVPQHSGAAPLPQAEAQVAQPPVESDLSIPGLDINLLPDILRNTVYIDPSHLLNPFRISEVIQNPQEYEQIPTQQEAGALIAEAPGIASATSQADNILPVVSQKAIKT